MIALLRRNIKIYFANFPGVVMSCLGALISFVIYVTFLQKSLQDTWSAVPHITKILDLLVIAGIVAVAGITISFQALGQLVKDRESRTADDLKLTGIPTYQQYLAYAFTGSLVSWMMQLVVFLIMATYFAVVDGITFPGDIALPLLGWTALGAVAATLLNMVVVLFIHSATTFSRTTAIIGAAAGFAVATYLPYGNLTAHAKTLVKLFPSSYEATSLRRLLLHGQLPAGQKAHLLSFLGARLQIHHYQLTQLDNAVLLLAVILALALIIVLLSAVVGRKRND